MSLLSSTLQNKLKLRARDMAMDILMEAGNYSAIAEVDLTNQLFDAMLDAAELGYHQSYEDACDTWGV